MSLKSTWDRVLTHVRRGQTRRLPGRGKTASRPRLEELEPRVLLATDLGTLVGRQYLTGHLDELGSEVYDFQLQDKAFLDAQVVDHTLAFNGDTALRVEGP